MILDAVGWSLSISENIFFMIFGPPDVIHVTWRRLLRTQPLLLGGAPQVGSGGVPAVCSLGTALIHDISGSSSSNEEFSTCVIMIFNVLSDYMHGL